MCPDCEQKAIVERNRVAIEGNGKPGLKSDMAVLKMQSKIIMSINFLTLGAIVKILFFGA